MKQSFVITAMGVDRAGIVSDLTDLINQLGGSIGESRMMHLSGQFGMMLQVSLEPAQASVFESSVINDMSKLGLTGLVKAVNPEDAPLPTDVKPYRIEILAQDEQGIVNRVSRFFAQRDITIEELLTDTFSAPQSGETLFELEMIILMPKTIEIEPFGDEFLDFADQYFLDASIEEIE